MKITVIPPSESIISEPFTGFRQALDPAEVQTRLSSLPYFQQDRASPERCSIRICRHKPGRRCLIEYDVVVRRSSNIPQLLTLIAKVRMKSHDHKTYALAQALWEAGMHDEASDNIAVPQPIGEIPEWHMWLQPKVPGFTLQKMLAGPKGEHLAGRVAEAATKIHHCGVGTHRRHTIADELRILNERLGKTACEYPHWSERLQNIAHRCESLAATLPEFTPRGIHRDFYPDQIIVDGDRLFLLDFDLYCEGDPALDIGNFIAHISEYSLRTLGDASALAHVEQALERRFLQLNPDVSQQAIQTYVTLTLARHIHISTLFDERRPFTQALLELTERRLEH